MTQSTTQTVTIDTLAAGLRAALSGGWTVTARFDHILATTPLCDRIEITPLAYSYTDVRWALVPTRRAIGVEIVPEAPNTDLAADVAALLRALSYRHSRPLGF
ncbi:hypothetical protein ACFVV7_36780 [Streptomyces globisporus]|uniref:hypothetical protein n=1 Tax=Streptomyces globisporus TaxID=1908 RepID=UPI0036DAFDEA